MFGRWLRTLGRDLDLYSYRAFPTPGCRRIHQTSAGFYHTRIDKLKHDEAVKWFENLSPEMVARKREVEHMIDVLLSQRPRLQEYEISLADLKCMMTECKSASSLQRYLIYKWRGYHILQDKREKIKRRKEEAMYLKNSDYKERSSSSYSLHSIQTYYRLRNHHLLSPFMFDALPIIFDMNYKQSHREHHEIVTELDYCMHSNRTFPEPCHMHVTSFKENSDLVLRRQGGNPFPGISLHEEGFEEIFPLEKLVYLSPYAPNLKQHNPGDIYVIGGVSDLQGPLSLKKVERMNIRCGSIPFQTHGIPCEMLRGGKRGYVLQMDTVFNLLLDINLKHDWYLVLEEFKKRLRWNRNNWKEYKPNHRRKTQSQTNLYSI